MNRLSNALLLCAALLPFGMFIPNAVVAATIPALTLLPLLFFAAIRDRRAILAAFWFVFALSLRWLPWPLPYIAPLVIFVTFTASVPRLRDQLSWLTLGRIDRPTLLLSVATTLGTSFVLWIWIHTANPDVSDLRSLLPSVSVGMLVLSCIAFSIANAAWEECLAKGILWSTLDRASLGFFEINVVQSFAFGLMHLSGFPRGPIGAALAALYGLLIGWIRKRSGGLLVPILTHFFADATIFALVATA